MKPRLRLGPLLRLAKRVSLGIIIIASVQDQGSSQALAMMIFIIIIADPSQTGMHLSCSNLALLLLDCGSILMGGLWWLGDAGGAPQAGETMTLGAQYEAQSAV